MDNFSKISYSVVIRTLGNSGVNYARLLESIKSQSIKPEEIIVAIPEGYELDFYLGSEIIVRAEKGMVTQRAYGISYAHSENILVVDDDIEFGPYFVQELDSYMKIHHLDCVLPMEGKVSNSESNTINLWYPLKRRIRSGFTGQLFQTNKESEYLDVMTVTAGHKVYCGSNKLDNCYYCQSGAFACLYINTQKAQDVHFENEKWLQQGSLSSYASYDDPAFYYHFYLQGNTIGYSLRTRFIHLDSSAGHVTKSSLERKRIRYFSIARNRTVFWYRFLYETSTTKKRKLIVILGGLYAFINYSFYTIIINFRPKYWKAIGSLFLGYKEAFEIIRSNNLEPLGLSYEERINKDALRQPVNHMTNKKLK